jgi:hypothetical protein
VQQLNQLRDEILQSTQDLQQITNPRLTDPLLAIENRLSNGISIPQPISPMESLVVERKLNECKFLLNDLENWHRYSNEPSSSLRKLIETFASQSLVSGNHDVFVLESTRVSISRIPGMEFSIIRLDRSLIESPKHWCLCAHEVGAHILKDAQQQPIFNPNLPQQMQSGRYGIAVSIWDGFYPPRRDGWFSEVYGDLWSCRRLGPGYLLGFIDYISSSNQNPGVGTREHPPSNLRITLMSRYLGEQGYPANTLPYHIQLSTLLPILMIDDSEIVPHDLKTDLLADGWEVYDLSDLLEVYDQILINEVEILAHSDLNNIPSNTNDILASYQAICNGSIARNNLVADVSGLAMFHHTNNDSLEHLIEEIVNAYF